MRILGAAFRLRGARTAMTSPRSGILLLLGLMAAFQMAAPAWADTCAGGTPTNPEVINPNMIRMGGGNAPGQQPELTVTGNCIINQAGNYYFGQVNIYDGGTLTFAEPPAAEPPAPNTQVAFWATSIIVEYNSSLIVGAANPYGSNGGFLTIYLYGNDLSKGMDPSKNQGQGVLCKTQGSGPCGIPLSVWGNNGKSVIPGCGTAKLTGQNCIPGLPTTVSDYFYQYGPLYGDGLCNNSTPMVPVVWMDGRCGNSSADGLVGYFGYKTLAVSFGATLRIHGYKGTPATNVDAAHTNAGVSWIRLGSDLSPGQTTLKLAEPGMDSTAVGNRWWREGDKSPPPNSMDLDQIVVTTTDYIPTHSETFTITSIDRDGVTVHFEPAARFLHRGTRFPLEDRLGSAQTRLVKAGMDLSLIQKGAETRAAVALLTRNVRIVSGGDTVGQTFDMMPANYSFGGHTIFRQGFREVQVDGVELQWLGQGGKIGHYPIHFHKTRLVPSPFAPNRTYIKDSAVNDSMTRWYVLHSTQGVTLQRNVGFKSIGHGYYLEDGTETDNNFYSDIGILARAAINNLEENPRSIPGILSDNTDNTIVKFPSPNVANPGLPYRSDNEYPTMFWITNGWNNFQGNMAAGAAACGVCYWFIPMENSDVPDVVANGNNIGGHMKWDDGAGHFGYAGMQRNNSLAGATPLKSFYKNYCTSAMMSFQTTADAPECNGFIPFDTTPPNLPTAKETMSFAPAPIREPLPPPDQNYSKPNLLADKYYPHTFGARFPTQCPIAPTPIGSFPAYDCSKVQVCADGTTNPSAQEPCEVVVLDHYTSAFNWAQGNVSAVWLRPVWYLLDNSVLSDVQQGALTFVSGGDFTHSSEIQGYWALARNTFFIGHTQPQRDMAHSFAEDSGPYNDLSKKLDKTAICQELTGTQGVPAYCLNAGNGISIPFGAFFVNQRMNNIYDGPAYQDSDVYLDTTTTLCPAGYNEGCIYGNGNAIGLTKDPATGNCYLPNAAIAWKQPNGFYYPPAFHTTNLFFDNVAMRHYVVDPIFKAPDGVTGTPADFGQGGTYITDQTKAQNVYCFPPPDAFNAFSGIDRQTELNDDDGTLTGLSNSLPQTTPPNPLKQTISVNDDDFFTAPVETPECRSIIGPNGDPANACMKPSTRDAPVTAKTSPYDYIATVVTHPVETTGGAMPVDIWSLDCANPSCYGVPLYRQFLAGQGDPNIKPVVPPTREWVQWIANGCDKDQTTPKCRWPFIRMAGASIATRETLTVNYGTYYLDTTVPASVQRAENFNQQGGPTTSITKNVNEFRPGETYTVFFLYAKPQTKQSYQIYIGKDPMNGSIKPVQVPIPAAGASNPLKGNPYTGTSFLTADTSQVATTGIVTVTVDFSGVSDLLAPTPANGLCQPRTFCQPIGSRCIVNPDYKNSSAALANPDLVAEAEKVCAQWAVKDLDCPDKGCLGFTFTLPSATFFQADATLANPSPHRPAPTVFPMVGEPKTGKPDFTTQFERTSLPPDNNAFTKMLPPGSAPTSCYYPKFPSTLPPTADTCPVP